MIRAPAGTADGISLSAHDRDPPEVCEPLAAFAGPIDPQDPPEVRVRSSGSRSWGMLVLLLANRAFASIASSAEEEVMSDRVCHGCGRGAPAAFLTYQDQSDPSISDPGLRSPPHIRLVVRIDGKLARRAHSDHSIAQQFSVSGARSWLPSAFTG